MVLTRPRHNFAPEQTHSHGHLECGRVMIPKRRFGWARLLTLAAGFSLAAVLAAAAQTPPADEEADAEEPAAEIAAAPDVNDPDIPGDIDVSKLDWSQLDLDASPLTGVAPQERAAPQTTASADAAWSAN